MKYIIADPDIQIGIDLNRILDDYKMMEFNGSYTTLEETVNSIGQNPPDIAFIRIGKVELNAFKLATMIRRLNALSKVVFLSNHYAYAVEAFECEADGFLLLPFKEEKIEQLLYKNIQGGVYDRYKNS